MDSWEIYAIINIETGQKVYIGSSKNSHKRWLRHKGYVREFIKKFDVTNTLHWSRYIGVQKIHAHIAQNGGINNFALTCLENCIDSKMNALIKEGLYILKYQPSQNDWIDHSSKNGYVGYRMPIAKYNQLQ